jgi:amino acid transporter
MAEAFTRRKLGLNSRSSSYRRQSSSPFLRKPLPPPHDDDTDEPQCDDSAKNNPNVSLSYDAIRQVDNHDSNDHEKSKEASHSIQRHLTLIDLIAIGLGGTIGSGFFVLAGLVSHRYAGPATVVSWLIAGFAACLSGCCYAELSARIPLAGSAYAYSYVAMGELPAILAAGASYHSPKIHPFTVRCTWYLKTLETNAGSLFLATHAACLSLEYIAASAAVARSWGDKCIVWLLEELHESHWIKEHLDAKGSSFSPLAFLISAGSICLLLNGVKESKRVTNFFTALKVAVVSFMVFVAFYHVRPSNWSPFVPPQFGVAVWCEGRRERFLDFLDMTKFRVWRQKSLIPKGIYRRRFSMS